MSIRSCLSALALTALPLAAAAQSPKFPDPALPESAAAPLHYESVFQTYRSIEPQADSPNAVWREANDAVGRIGGHAGYMRAAHDAAGQASAAKDEAAEWSPVAPHSGHHGGHH